MFKRVLLSLVSVSCLVGSWSVFADQGKATNNIAFAIHGGAGTILKENMTSEKEQAYLNKLDETGGSFEIYSKEGGVSNKNFKLEFLAFNTLFTPATKPCAAASS